MIDNTASDGGLTNAANGNQIGSPALLAAGLSDNGGPTLTIALLTGSPAINGGAASIAGYTVPATDERGRFAIPPRSTTVRQSTRAPSRSARRTW